MFLTPYQLALIAGGFTILGALLGNWISHRFSSSRDRIKEFNDAADILDDILRKERCGPAPTTNIDFSAFRRVLTEKELIRFDRCVEEYHQAKRNAEIVFPEKNEAFVRISSGWYHDVNPIVAEIDKLMKFTKRK